MDSIRQKIPFSELLAQLAEECTELAHAALKLRRCMDGTNPTPKSRYNAELAMLEEIADVLLCLKVCGFEDGQFRETEKQKLARWKDRLSNDLLGQHNRDL